MCKKIFHTDKEGIPCFGIITYQNGRETEIEFVNKKTGARETYPVDEFITRLREMVRGER